MLPSPDRLLGPAARAADDGLLIRLGAALRSPEAGRLEATNQPNNDDPGLSAGQFTVLRAMCWIATLTPRVDRRRRSVAGSAICLHQSSPDVALRIRRPALLAPC
jgi:hypothetical protein